MHPAIRAFEKLVIRLGTISGFGVLVTMVAISLDVVGRSFFNTPLPGATEVSELLLIALIFLGLAAAQRERRHYTVDLVTDLLPPGVKRVVKAFALLVSLAVVALLFYYSARQGWSSLMQNEINYGLIPFPVWPARLVLAFGLGLLCIQFVIDIYRTVSGYEKPAPDGVTASHGE